MFLLTDCSGPEGGAGKKEEVAGIIGGPLQADWFVAASFVARHE